MRNEEIRDNLKVNYLISHYIRAYDIMYVFRNGRGENCRIFERETKKESAPVEDRGVRVGAAVYGKCHAEGKDTVHRARRQMQCLYQRANSATVRRCVSEGGRGSLGTAKDIWTGQVVRRPPRAVSRFYVENEGVCLGLCVITVGETRAVLSRVGKCLPAWYRKFG